MLDQLRGLIAQLRFRGMEAALDAEIERAERDRVVPVENAQKLYDAVGSANKTIKIFTTEEGGAEHAHVDNRQIGIDFAADWLAERFADLEVNGRERPRGRVRAGRD